MRWIDLLPHGDGNIAAFTYPADSWFDRTARPGLVVVDREGSQLHSISVPATRPGVVPIGGSLLSAGLDLLVTETPRQADVWQPATNEPALLTRFDESGHELWRIDLNEQFSSRWPCYPAMAMVETYLYVACAGTEAVDVLQLDATSGSGSVVRLNYPSCADGGFGAHRMWISPSASGLVLLDFRGPYYCTWVGRVAWSDFPQPNARP